MKIRPKMGTFTPISTIIYFNYLLRKTRSYKNVMQFKLDRAKLLAAVLLLPSLLFAQTIYVWEDSQGNKHYTQLRPDEQVKEISPSGTPESYVPEGSENRGTKFQTVESSSAFLIDSNDAIRLRQRKRQEEVEAIQEAQREQEKQAQNAIEQAEKERQQNCDIARENLELLDQYIKGNYSGLNYVDDEGNEVSLDQAAIDEIHTNTLQEVDYFCN